MLTALEVPNYEFKSEINKYPIVFFLVKFNVIDNSWLGTFGVILPFVLCLAS